MTQDHLKTLLEYDQATRSFTWLVGQWAGRVAGSLTSGGHRIAIEGKSYDQSDLLVLYRTGVLPKRKPKRSPWRNN